MMKDKIITLFFLGAACMSLSIVLDGAKAQNGGRPAHAQKRNLANERWVQIDYCMRLPDINDVRRCVEGIK